MQFGFDLSERIGTRATFGLVVLMSDETLEHDMRRMLPVEEVALYVSRIHCEPEVSGDTLSAMERDLPAAIALFPDDMPFDCVGYGCTSGTSVIGARKVAELVHSACSTAHVTEPVSALVAACGHLSLRKLAILTPYVEEVSSTLRSRIADAGIESPVFGSFNEGDDRRVARINPQSIFDAAVALVEGQDSDGLFISCTNLRTLDVIARLETRLGLPVLSSNQVMAWQMAQHAGLKLNAGFGRLIDG